MSQPRGTYHVEDFGAVARGITDDPPQGQRTTNTAALNAACAAALAGRGTLLIGPGVYHVNGPWGFSVTVDTSVAVTLKGVGSFPAAMVSSNNNAAQNFQIHSTIPNIRAVVVEDVQFVGGRTAASMLRCFYSRFTRVWFWGANQFALQLAFCGELEFEGCLFTETGAFGDAVLLFASHAVFKGTTWGEGGGGVVAFDSTMVDIGGTFQAGCYYRGKNYTDYWTTPGSPVTVSLAFYAGEEAAIIAANTDLFLHATKMRVAKIGVSIDLGHTVSLKGVHFVTDGAEFEGFVNVMRNFDLALMVDGQFQWEAQSGYFIKEAAGLLHDAIVTAQLINHGGTITAIGTSAPALLNPGNENNLVTTRTFTR